MCCIFTWMAWCFDASHRVVVFIMACLISSSICCLLLIASMAGVAMGYNYSLAEYIDLKETNISVYIKRGVYDDEIADDFDWRRSGKDGDVVAMNNPNLKDEQPLAARRRLKDSAFESEDENRYEGSLMRLTSAPSLRPLYQPEPPYTTSPKTTNRVDSLLAIADSLPGGSVERLRAIQAAARYHENSKVELAGAQFPDDASARMKVIEANAQIHDARRQGLTTTTDKYAKYFNQLARYPGMPGSDVAARRFQVQQERDMDIGSPDRFREVVFKGHLAGMTTGAVSKPTTGNFFEYESPDTKHLPLFLTSRPQKGKDTKSKADEPRPDYEDAQGLPTRKKRNNKLNETLDIKIKVDNLNATAEANTEHLSNMVSNAKASDLKVKNDIIEKNSDKEAKTDIKNNSDIHNLILVKVSDVKMNDKDARNINGIHTEASPKTMEHSTLMEQMNSKENEGYKKVSINELIRNYFDYLTNRVMQSKESTIRKRRRKFKGNEFMSRESKDVKSIWWRFSDGVHELRNNIFTFVNRQISPV